MNINKDKTIEQLENSIWEIQNDSTGLVQNCFRLRKIPLRQLDENDLRILINQNIGIEYTIPLAIEILQKNPFVESLYYNGDLIEAVMNSEKEFWKKHNDLKTKLIDIFEKNKIQLDELDITTEIKNDILDSYNKFGIVN